MEVIYKAKELFNKAISNDIVVNIFLVSAFGGLAFRSLNHQREIEALESQRESLAKSNKSMRQMLWDWKQNLYAQAQADGNKAVVSLENLKAIYGEVPTLSQSAGTAEKKDVKAPATKIMI